MVAQLTQSREGSHASRCVVAPLVPPPMPPAGSVEHAALVAVQHCCTQLAAMVEEHGRLQQPRQRHVNRHFNDKHTGLDATTVARAQRAVAVKALATHSPMVHGSERGAGGRAMQLAGRGRKMTKEKLWKAHSLPRIPPRAPKATYTPFRC